MNSGTRPHGPQTLAQAKALLRRQATEIEDLRRQLEDQRRCALDDQLARDLREIVSLIATVDVIARPVQHAELLEMIVATAADVIAARAASLFLIEGDDLVFEVALGEKAAEVKKFRVPLGHGIAGIVAVTGQPMAISQAQDDPRHAAEIARSIGYTPESILCVPLYYAEQVIGVLELLDKEGAPSFSADDMRILGRFANQAAVAIAISRLHQNMEALAGERLATFFAGRSSALDREVAERLRAFARRSAEADAGYQQALSLAQLVHDIAARGENEARACQAVLRSFSDYVQLRPESTWEMEAVG